MTILREDIQGQMILRAASHTEKVHEACAGHDEHQWQHDKNIRNEFVVLLNLDHGSFVISHLTCWNNFWSHSGMAAESPPSPRGTDGT